MRSQESEGSLWEYRMLGVLMYRRSEEGKKLRKESMQKGVDYTPFQAKQPYLRNDGLMNTLTLALTKDNLIVLAIPKSTSTQYQFTKGNSMAYDKVKLNPQIAPTVRAEHHNCLDVHYIAKGYPTMETSQKSTQNNSQTSTAWSEDFLAKLLASLENDVASRIPEGRYSLTLREYCEQNNQDSLSLKTLKDFSATMVGELLQPSSKRLMSWGTTVNGKCLTARITESHKTGSALSLSDILEEHPDPKYFLSQDKVTKILRSASQQKPQLLEHLQEADIQVATTQE